MPQKTTVRSTISNLNQSSSVFSSSGNIGGWSVGMPVPSNRNKFKVGDVVVYKLSPDNTVLTPLRYGKGTIIEVYDGYYNVNFENEGEVIAIHEDLLDYAEQSDRAISDLRQ